MYAGLLWLPCCAQVFEAVGEPEVDIEPDAWRPANHRSSPFQSQIRVKRTREFNPVRAQRNRMPTGKLTPQQAAEALALFSQQTR